MNINNLNELAQVVHFLKEKSLGIPMYFRGQSNHIWNLTPSLSRLENINYSVTEKKIIRRFNQILNEEKIPFIQSHPTDRYKYGETWNLLLQCQHLGLPTRLIDWSISPETAMYFAVNENPEIDGKFFIMAFNLNIHYNFERIREDHLFDNDPFLIDNTILVNQSFTAFKDNIVKLGEERMRRQFGRFLMQPLQQINIPFEITWNGNSNYELKEFTVTSEAKKQIISELKDRNINSETLALTPNEKLNEILKSIKEEITL